MELDYSKAESIPVLTGNEAADWDAYSIDEKGISSRMLMGWAGYSVFQSLRARKWFKKATHIHFLVGKGNNGGDGFVIAWQVLASTKKKVSLWQLGPPATDDASYFFELCKQHPKVKINPLAELKTRSIRGQLVIDCLFGTGLNKPLSTELQEQLASINNAKCKRIAIDIASGVYANGDAFSHTCFAADHTFTFGSYKIGHLVEPGILSGGRVWVQPIGFFPRKMPNRRLLKKVESRKLRQGGGHKYSSGVLHVLGGGEGMEGAAVMTGFAFLKLGGGLARLYSTSEAIKKTLQEKPELMINTGTPAELEEAFLTAVADGKRAQTAVIGVGLTFAPSVDFWQKILAMENLNLVLDGSVLKHMHQHVALFASNQNRSLVVTPHLGEAAALLNSEVGNVRETALKIARAYQARVFLKGPGGILVMNRREVYANSRHAQLATGGTGDVLCGFIANMLHRYDSIDDALEKALATYLQAADRVVNKKSKDKLVATDLIKNAIL